ncbi:tetratricopeptide repeat protein [Evansella halocellulosilytica]|uniref:tetratricopeptide repeat protein n=1 Tax=Evansella halocellulosilytica TaxID=2011013 RepID=UPI000BB6D7CB|nr:tetratricopeptide repeat protein [Evansella halocellulosilytica]
MHIGNRLKKIRKLNRVSQQNLCKGIVSTSHYSNIEGGRYVPSTDILESIAKRLQVPTNYLLNIHEHSPTTDKLLTEYEELIENDLAKAEEFLQKNKKEFEYIPSIYQETEFLLLRCMHHIKQLNLNEAEKLYDEIQFYIQEEELDSYNKNLKFKYTYVTGLLKYDQKNYTDSYHYFNKASKYLSDESKRMKVTFNLALISFYLFNLTKALEYVISARTAFLENHRWKETVECYILQGMILFEMRNFEEAKKVLKKGLNLAKEKSLYIQTTKIHHNLGNVYRDNEEYDKALYYYKESLEKKKIYDKDNVLITYYTLAKLYLKQKDLPSLKKLLGEVRDYCESEFDFHLLKMLEAKMEYLLMNYEKYEDYMKKSIEYFYKQRHFIILENECKHISDYYYDQKKYKSAYYYLDMEMDVIQKIYKEPRV